MNWYDFHYNKEGDKRRLFKLRERLWKAYLYWYHRLKIRFEKCPECNKTVINRSGNLGYDLYMKQKDCTWCKKCSESLNDRNRL